MMTAMPVKTQDTTVKFRVNAEDLERWKEAADTAGLTLSNWIRHQCNAAAPSLEMIRTVEKNLAAIEKRERGPSTKKGGRR